MKCRTRWMNCNALTMMIVFLKISIYEFQISTKALDLHLSDMGDDVSEYRKSLNSARCN